MNVRSYIKNRAFIEEIILSDKYDVIAIQETWLKKKIAIPHTGYKVIDLFSDQTKGSGTRILVKSDIQCYQERVYLNNIVEIKLITNSNKHLFFISAYA